MSTLQAKVSDLRLHNRLLTSQLAAERQDSSAKLEDIEAKSRLLIQTLQDRLAAAGEEDSRRRERWVREREGWERGVREKDSKLAAMRDRMAQWERQVGVVNAEMRQMGDAIRQREQRTEDEHRKREATWEEERRTWKQHDDEREDERLETQRAMKRLVDEMRDMNEELNRRDDKQRRLRAAASRLASMDKEWKRLRNERRSALDGRVLQLVRKQHELLTELGTAERQAASSEEEKGSRVRETETDTADSDKDRYDTRTGAAKRSQRSATTRARSHPRIIMRKSSAAPTHGERDTGIRRQPAHSRPASSAAVWPPAAAQSLTRITRPQSATGFNARPSYPTRESTGGAAVDGYVNGSRTKPRLPATFLSQRSTELLHEYKSMFTPHTAHDTYR